MIEIASRTGEDHVENIAALSRQLEIPVHDVRAVYEKTLDQMTAAARIPTFLGVLTTRSTRAILRQQSKRAVLR